jgi:hypothetical protein
MANNNSVIDAVVAGAGGGAQAAWLTATNAATYNNFQIAIDTIATAVDGLIPTVPGGPTFSQLQLLQSISQAVFQGRFPTNATPAVYADIAQRIVLLYNKLLSSLTNQPSIVTPTRVTKIYFVDAGQAPSVVALRNGTIATPYATIQEAVNAIIATTLNTAIVMVAPGSYGAAIVVPASATLSVLTISGWCADNPVSSPGDLPDISGAITTDPLIQVDFVNVNVLASILSPPNPATQDAVYAFTNCNLNTAIEALNLTVMMIGCEVEGGTTTGNATLALKASNSIIRGITTGLDLVVNVDNTELWNDVIATGTLQLTIDGASYSTMIHNGVNPLPAGYTRYIRGTTSQRIPTNFTALGLAIGTTAMVTIPMAAWDIRSQDTCVLSSEIATGVEDFMVTFQHVDPAGGAIVVAVTNLSRVSTNFNPQPIAVTHFPKPYT